MKSSIKIGLTLGGIILFALCFLVGVSLSQAAPQVSKFFTGISSWEYQVQGQTVVYYSDGTEMGRIGYKRQYSEDFPQFLKQAVVAVEDRRFYEHSGFDAKSIGRAIYNDIKAGSRAEGGSTITQQLARTIFLTNEKSFIRKIKELFIAISIEDKYTKDAILNMYLNEIYIGRGCSGLPIAANTYFGKNVNQLNKAEITMLVGMIQSPEYYNPEKNIAGLKERQQTVVEVLVDQEIITDAEGKTILAQKVTFKPYQPYSTEHPYYMNYLSNQLENVVGAQKLYGGGLKIYTTIDPVMQKSAEQAVTSNAASLKARGITAQDMALISVDPSTGGIKAMVGGVDFSNNQINMAVMPRQPGSSIKPLYYAAAINEGIIKADTQLNNQKRDFNGYSPDNYENSPSKVTVKQALVYSHNVASVEVLNKLGVEKAIKYMTDYGITSIDKGDHNLALGLGGMTRGISPLQMASAYTIFPAQGRHEDNFTIVKIVDAGKKTIYEDRSSSKRVISSTTALVMDNILKAVVSEGTGTNARIGISSGGKTGTTEGKSGNKTSQDLWYIGYTSELVTAVWAGNSDNSEIKGFGTYGGTVCGPVWRNYMNKLISQGVLTEKSSWHQEEEAVPTPETVKPDESSTEAGTGAENVDQKDTITNNNKTHQDTTPVISAPGDENPSNRDQEKDTGPRVTPDRTR